MTLLNKTTGTITFSPSEFVRANAVWKTSIKSPKVVVGVKLKLKLALYNILMGSIYETSSKANVVDSEERILFVLDAAVGYPTVPQLCW